MDDLDEMMGEMEGGAAEVAPPPPPTFEFNLERAQDRRAARASVKAAAKSKAKAKAKGPATPAKSKICFIASCPNSRRAKSKFCGDRHKDVECIKYQAKGRVKEDPDALKAVEEALSDASKASLS